MIVSFPPRAHTSVRANRPLAFPSCSHEPAPVIFFFQPIHCVFPLLGSFPTYAVEPASPKGSMADVLAMAEPAVARRATAAAAAARVRVLDMFHLRR